VLLLSVLACSEPPPPGPDAAAVVAWVAAGASSGSVSIAGRGVADEVFAAAVRDPAFPPALRSLTANGNQLGPASFQALDEAGQCATLAWLNVTANPLGDAGAHALAETACVGQLEQLFIGEAGLSGSGMAALAGAGLPRLTLLVAGGQPLGGSVAEPLAALPALRRLALPAVGMSPAGARTLITKTTASELDLAHNDLGAGALVGLSEVAAGLEVLSLASCGLGPADAVALAAAPRGGLVELDLTGNPLGDDGLRSLAGAPWLAELDKLRVEQSGASLEVRKALVDAWGARGGIKVERR
jgi:hypothetical protein